MGYACPVCEIPQQDGPHLANHLAFTAILGDDDHEAWLDEKVPEWAERDEGWLAERVVALAPEREFPQVFEDTVREGPGQPDMDAPRDARYGTHRGAPDRAIARALAEARELTERRRERADGSDRAADREDEPTDDSTPDPDGNG